MRSFPLTAIALLFCAITPISISAQRLKSAPRVYDFGAVDVGQSSTFTFVLTNKGNKLLRITSMALDGSDFSFGSLQLPLKLKPGSSVQLNAAFTPQKTGLRQGVGRISSNDPNSPLNIILSGTGGSKQRAVKKLTLSPKSLDFGNVTVGSSAGLTVTLTASGGAVTLSSDRTNSSEFTISGLTLPLKIPSGQSVQATLQFTPNASGTASAKAGFFSNAKDSPVFELLKGTGVAQSGHEVDLTWDPGDGNAVGYNVYRGTTHGGPYQQLNSSLVASTNYSDTGVQGGTTYFYVATEVDGEGRQSPYSTETQAVVPVN
jgi:Abnormal spindle-like microcephaly-assoc'd, ASPM-SPD-2-Hydin